MLAVRLDQDTENRISRLSKITGRPKSYYVREALQRYLDDIEDIHDASYRLKHPAKTISLEEVKKEFDE